MSTRNDSGVVPGRADDGVDAGPGSLAWRLSSLEALLDRACVVHRGVRAAGPGGEIAVIDAPVTEVAALATLAREIRLLGFRYTTVDLAHAPDGARAEVSRPQPAEPSGVEPEP